MRFGVLGPLGVWTTGGAAVRVPEVKVRLLLADLLAHEGRPVSADRLAFDLWGDRPPGNPVNTLQTKVSQLRRALEAGEPGGRELVAHGPAGYAVPVDSSTLDVLRFRELVADGRWGEALALWRGEPLAEFADAPFLVPVTARWAEERLVAVEGFAESGGVGLVDLAVEVARHPLRERLRGLHMRALYRAGRQVEALASYAELRRLLVEEQGLEPGPELVALHRAILDHDPALGPVAPSGPGAAVGSGTAIGSGTGRTPGTAPGPGAARTNLPVPVTELVGREQAVRDLCGLPRDTRLVTLTGPGGVGKTSLALEVARRVSVADGAWLVELAGVGRAEQVIGAVADVLGVREDASGSSLVEALRGREVLLVLDNCERLVEPVAALVSRLLRAVPGLRVLATSQEPLGLAFEAVWAVPPLDLSDAVTLFAARAAAAAPGFAVTPDNEPVVEAICRRLDGLPLAVELAATRVRGLGVTALLDRLDDRFRLLATGHRDAPARQRTLRAMIDWSWDLLGDAERIVLRRLSVHVDGCALDAAEAVCAGGGVAADEVLDVLTRLVDRSLVVAPEHTGEPRFRLLESVADYGRERLREAGELDRVRDRHAAFYLALAERADPELRGPRQLAWLARLDADTANLRAAHDALGPAGAARLTCALTWYWFLRGRLREGRRLMTATDPVTVAWRAGFGVLLGEPAEPSAISGTANIDDATQKARARWFLGYVLSTVGDMASGERLTDQALAAFEELGDQWGVAAAHSDRVSQALAGGRVDRARASAARATELFAASGERWGQLKASFGLGMLAQLAGDYERAEAVHRDGLRVAQELRSWPEVSYKLSWLGRVALTRGDYAQARELHEQARRTAAEHGFSPGEVYAETGLALGARREGRLDEAEALWERLRAWHRRVGFEAGATLVLAELGFVAEQRGDAARALELQSEALSLARRVGDPRAIALALEGVAGARALAGDAATAARLLGAATAARASVGVPLPVGERADVDRIAAAARDALGDEPYAAAFAAGHAEGLGVAF
ncbi:winged helix-turn-helix domain-containing protein [Saccharothrix sp. S26]|uniref:AfsR/SARP family transcriptional regulator n=1 Tax=Saccharothrix sp. S26 TaxID=2907215 RepID=UPI001F3D3D5A|nr:BTAD domain-containing putative transcriptional regulator [Saccharothrix sp. S26]MCE7000014.1 winged helix-turn-helix domain-containing protein [Saccharothrix sp. S26]